MEHVEHDEPDGGGLAEAAKERREGGAEHGGEVAAERLGAEHAEPNQRKHDEIDAGHGRRGEHRARHVLVGVHGLADMAGGGLEGRGREADQIEAGHHRGEVAEPALERRRQVEVEGLVPIDVAGDDRCQRGEEGKRGGRRGNGHRETRHPFDATHVHKGEQEHDGDGHGLDRKTGEIPLLDRRGREQRRQSAGRHPAPPVAGAGQGREHGVVGPEGLGAGRRNAADAVGPHQHELGPGRRRGPAEKNPGDEQRHRGAALPENGALAHEQRRDQEDHLIAAAHGERGCTEPA